MPSDEGKKDFLAARDSGVSLSSLPPGSAPESSSSLASSIVRCNSPPSRGTRNPVRYHFDGGCGLNATGTARLTNCLIPSLAPQEEVFSDAGFYFQPIQLQPFIRFEWNGFKDQIDHSKDTRRYGGGFNYYVSPSQQNLKVTAAIERIVPNVKPSAASKIKNTTQYLVQFQFYYF